MSDTDSPALAAWEHWARAPRPFESFRTQQTQAPTYKIECDLDHQADYIDALMEAMIEQNPDWDVPLGAKLELRDLGVLEAELAKLNPSLPNVRSLWDYMRVARRLLEAASKIKK